MITLSLQVIKEAALSRPTGYLEDVLSFAEIDGDNVKLSNDDYARLTAKYSGPTDEEKEAHKPICLACEWLNKESLKCMHPNCACPVSPLRVEPWMNLKRCSAGSF